MMAPAYGRCLFAVWFDSEGAAVGATIGAVIFGAAGALA
jgi:hypothetical protein